MRNVIEVTPTKSNFPIKLQQLRVAAYCRVSTELEEQTSSIELQEQHYARVISENPNWNNAGIFSERATGLNLKDRPEFCKLIIKHRLTMVNTPLNKALGVRNQIFHSKETRSAVAWTWERMMSATCRRSSKSMLSQFPRWEDRYSIFCGETLSAFSAAISLISP